LEKFLSGKGNHQRNLRELAMHGVESAAAVRDKRFAAQLLALDSLDAAKLLLQNGTLVDGEYGDHYYVDSSFTSAKPSTTPIDVPEHSSFARIDRWSLPDNSPEAVGPSITSYGHHVSYVHRFVLQPEHAIRVNAQLRHDAIRQSEQSEGVVVSNAGGFHSVTTRLDPALQDDAWHGPLRPLLLEALHALHADGLVAGCPIKDLHLTGWLNVSSSTSFNQPHDHGGVPYSAVYFVDDGGSSAQPCAPSMAPFEQPSSCAGELLFQTQPVGWSRQYALHAVQPVPGTICFFPGYMPHAVLPRALLMHRAPPDGTQLDPAPPPIECDAPPPRTPRDDVDDGGGDTSVRISVAINVYGYEHIELPKAWQDSRRVVAKLKGAAG
jgi:hypothetical protein